MSKALLIVSCMALAVGSASSQESSKSLSFEVASVKPAAPSELDRMAGFPNGPPVEMMRFRGGPGSKSPGRIDYVGVTLKMLLKRAYDVPAEQILGPGWLDTERYDIAATLPPETNAEQLRSMLQQLLTERFQIYTHRESKSLPVYFLLVAKNGPKLQPARKLPEYKDDEERNAAMKKNAMESLQAMRANMNSGAPHYRRSFGLARATMGKLAETLSSHVDHTVIDKTHLDGVYSFDLKWNPEGAMQPGDAPGPSIFTAVEEQLGLKLQRGNEERQLLVIDKAEKSPIGN